MKHILRHIELFKFFLYSYTGKVLNKLDPLYPDSDMLFPPSWYFGYGSERGKIIRMFFE